MEIEKKIHCKLSYDNQIRRFVINNTEFYSLKNQVAEILGLNDEFVLKYLDNESDLVTLASNEELEVALDVAEKVLRLVVEKPAPSLQHASSLPEGHWRAHMHHGPGHHGPGHHGGKWRGRGGRSTFGDRSVDKWEAKKIQMNMKLDMLKNYLAQLPSDDSQLSTYDISQKHHLLLKINRIEGTLLKWDTIKEKKRDRQKYREEKKVKKRNYSPETEAQIQLLKAQIHSLKPAIFQLKTEIKQKKMELDTCLQTGIGEKEAIWQDILKKKERLFEIKKEIAPLKENVRILKEK
jgi:hypothetical protein